MSEMFSTNQRKILKNVKKTEPPKADSVQIQLARILEITKCKTQAELASLLNTSPSSISIALRRGKMPPVWLVKLQLLGVNIDWIMTGNEPRYQQLPKLPTESASQEQKEIDENKVIQKILSCIPLHALVDEISRRLDSKKIPENI